MEPLSSAIAGMHEARHHIQSHSSSPLRKRRDVPGGAGTKNRSDPPDTRCDRGREVLPFFGDRFPDRRGLQSGTDGYLSMALERSSLARQFRLSSGAGSRNRPSISRSSTSRRCAQNLRRCTQRDSTELGVGDVSPPTRRLLLFNNSELVRAVWRNQ